MPDENATPVEATSPDALTEAEMAYLNSGGENADALIAEAGGTTAEPETAKPEGDANPADTKSADTKPAADAKPAEKAAEAEPATHDDDTAADIASSDPQQKPPTRVSYHKFKRTEDRLKAAELREAELREKFARGDERLKLLAEALTVAPPKEGAAEDDPKPDPEQDIFAYVRWQDRQIEKLGKELQGTKGAIGETRETIQQRDQADEMKSTYQRDAIRFAQTTPDFVHAYNHMLGARAAMLEDQGYTIEDIKGILANEERGLVQRAMQANKSPAEMIYAMAQRFGYRKAEAAAANGATQDGAAAAEAKPAANGSATNGKPSATEILENVRNGQAASKTLSGTGGAASDLSVEALVNMSEADFNALLRAKPAQVEALMGRQH